MTVEEMDDLKQFIVVTVQQSEERLRAEMRAGFAGVAEMFEYYFGHFDGRLTTVEAMAHTHPQAGQNS